MGQEEAHGAQEQEISNVESRGRLIVWCAIGLLVNCILYRLFDLALLYVDDYNYGTFLSEGFRSFVDKNIDHYINMNGRVMVHLLVQMVTHYGTTIFPVVAILVVTALAVVLAMLGDIPLKSREFVLFDALFVSLILAIQVVTLREGLLWISAFFNYVFPMLAIALLLFYFKECYRDGKIYFFGIPVFFCVATTEQCGAVAFLMVVACLIYYKWMKKITLKLELAPLVAAILGYLTFLLAPSTFSRFNMATDGMGGLMEHIAGWCIWIQECMGLLVEGNLHLVLLLLLAMVFFFHHVLPQRGLQWASGGMIFLLMGSWIFAWSAGALVALFLLLAGYLCLAGLYIGLQYNLFYGLLLLGGVGSLAVPMVSNTLEPRVTLPLLLALIGVTCLMLVKVAPQRAWRSNALPLDLIVVLCLAAVYPVLQGYTYNHQLEETNIAQIEAGKETGLILYSIDHDQEYGHSQMYTDGWIYTKFLDYYEIEAQTEVRLVSEIHPAVVVGGEILSSPAILEEGIAHFPLRAIVETLGGACDWSRQGTEITVGEYRYLLDDHIFYDLDSGAKVMDAQDYAVSNYMSASYEAVVWTELFHLEIQYDGETNTYTIAEY